MKIRASLHRYQLHLNRPLLLAGQTLESREGLIVRLVDDDGHEGLGEIAPLPGFSREKLPDAESQARLVLDEINVRDWPDAIFDKWEESELLARVDGLYHSVSCGISSALLGLMSSYRNIPLHKLIDPTAVDNIYINALLSGTDDEILDRAARLKDLGFRAAKLKVGFRSVAEDVQLVRNVRQAFPPSATLRLDANRRCTIEQANEFLAQIKNIDIEYLEESVNNLRRLPELASISDVPIALDESLPQYFATGMQSRYLPKAIVVKPTLVGGWGRCLKFRDWARERKIKIVISSSFESAVGLRVLAFLAAVVSGGTPCGLDTSSWFRTDLIEGGLPISMGSCELNALKFDWSSLETRQLTEVSLG